MNLSDLVQVYGSKDGQEEKTQEKSVKESRGAKKSGTTRSHKSKQFVHRGGGAAKHQGGPIYPQTMIVPQTAGSYAYDPSYAPHYPAPMVRDG